MKKITLCDGSELEYEPKYETTTECQDCEAIYLLDEPIEIDPPDTHKGPWERSSEHSSKCISCGAIAFDARYIINLELERFSKAFEENFNKNSTYFDYINKK